MLLIQFSTPRRLLRRADLTPTQADIDDDSAWSIVGRTEMTDNNLNPKVKDFIQRCNEPVY